jgi:hypothetical protein
VVHLTSQSNSSLLFCRNARAPRPLPGSSIRDTGRGRPGARARGIGRVDRAGLDRAGNHAGSCEAVVADLHCGHADLGAARGAAGVAGAISTRPPNGRRSSTWIPMNGWSSYSQTRPAACTRCAARRICCPASRGARNAAGACTTATTRAAGPKRMRALRVSRPCTVQRPVPYPLCHGC